MTPASTNASNSSQTIDLMQSEVTSIIICCLLTLKDGTVMGFTNNTESFAIDGVLYKATTLLALSNIESKNNFSVDNLDITGVLDSDDIKEHDILAGRYDSAQIEVFTVNYPNLKEKTIQRRGTLGEITTQGDKFIAEVRGLAQALQCNIGELYSPTCRANLGDAKCKVNLEHHTYSGIVKRVDLSAKRQIFTAICENTCKQDGYFTLGEIIWLTGKNSGLRMEIREFVGSRVILALSMPHTIQKGDTFKIVAGCDKTFSACCNKFKNAINFRGEPHLPGTDKLLQMPN